jgi:hypothetical protein
LISRKNRKKHPGEKALPLAALSSFSLVKNNLTYNNLAHKWLLVDKNNLLVVYRGGNIAEFAEIAEFNLRNITIFSLNNFCSHIAKVPNIAEFFAKKLSAILPPPVIFLLI